MVKENTERIHNGKCKSFHPSPVPLRGSPLPVSSISLQRCSLWSINFTVKTSCNYKRGLLVWDENLGGIWSTFVSEASTPYIHHSHRKLHQNILSVAGQWVWAAGPLKQKAGDRQARPSWFWFSFHSLSCSPLGTVGFISYDSSRKVLKDGSVRCPHLWRPRLLCCYL